MIRKKSWKEMMAQVRSTFRKWGVRTYAVEPATAPGRRNLYYNKSQRPVSMRFTLYGKSVALRSDDFGAPHENLERLALTLETMRLSQERTIEPLLLDAYRQIYPTAGGKPPEPASVDTNDPYAVLGVGRHYPLSIIEAIWKARLRVEHPDAGGQAEAAARLNAAMADIRKRRQS